MFSPDNKIWWEKRSVGVKRNKCESDYCTISIYFLKLQLITSRRYNNRLFQDLLHLIKINNFCWDAVTQGNPFFTSVVPHKLLSFFNDLDIIYFMNLRFLFIKDTEKVP
jgi:hypothetical protein